MNKFLMLLLVAVLASACGDDVYSEHNQDSPWTEVMDGAGIYDKLYETRLPDGTHCLYYDSGRAGGLECDWPDR